MILHCECGAGSSTESLPSWITELLGAHTHLTGKWLVERAPCTPVQWRFFCTELCKHHAEQGYCLEPGWDMSDLSLRILWHYSKCLFWGTLHINYAEYYIIVTYVIITYCSLEM